ncbi:ATP-binding protein [Roseateles sp.]|uniref:sensor histidine kinase n=1 Tax=Roseateles sp. TaxID=1971397 RepID=UPI003D0FA3AB
MTLRPAPSAPPSLPSSPVPEPVAPAVSHPADAQADPAWLQALDELILEERQDEALESLHQWLAQPDLTPDLVLRLQARELRLQLLNGCSPAAAEQAYALLESAQSLGSARVSADALCSMALVQSATRLTAAAMQAVGQADALYESIGDTRSRQLARLLLARVLMAAEMFVELIRQFEPLLEGPDACDDRPVQDGEMPPRLRCALLLSVGAAYANANTELSGSAEGIDSRQAIPIYRRALALAELIGSPPTRVRCRFSLANLMIWTGQLDEAAQLLREVEQLAAQQPLSLLNRAHLRQNQALLAWKSGRAREALLMFCEVRAMCEQGGLLFLLGRALLRLAECAEDCGDLAQALEARQAQVQLLGANLRAQQQNFGQGMLSLVQHARVAAQNELLQRQGNSLEQALAQRNGELNETLSRLRAEMSVRRAAEAALTEAHAQLELKVAQRTRELELAMRRLMEHEKQAALSYLVAGVAHELNTPLGNALLATSSAQAGLQEFGQAFEANRLRRQDVQGLRQNLQANLDIVSHGLERATVLLRNFKALALQDSSEEVEWMDAAQVAHNTLQAFTGALREAGVTLDLSGLQPLRLRGHAAALSQVLAQLIENALLHAFQGWSGERRLSLRGRALPEGLELRVADSGHGIAREHQAHVFDPFFSTRMGQGGSGLGLYLAQRLVVQRLGGELALNSAPGRGAEFIIRLPS